jgi:acyl carrier protein
MASDFTWDNFTRAVADYMGMETAEIKNETNIYADLGMDSLRLFSLGLTLIKTFKRKIPLAAVSTIETVGDIFDQMSALPTETE